MELFRLRIEDEESCCHSQRDCNSNCCDPHVFIIFMIDKVIVLLIMRHDQNYLHPKVNCECKIKPNRNEFLMPWNDQRLQTFACSHIWTTSHSNGILRIWIPFYDLEFLFAFILFEFFGVPDKLFTLISFRTCLWHRCFSTFVLIRLTSRTWARTITVTIWTGMSIRIRVRIELLLAWFK
jgi:hypothetical protein